MVLILNRNNFQEQKAKIKMENDWMKNISFRNFKQFHENAYPSGHLNVVGNEIDRRIILNIHATIAMIFT